MAESRQAGRTTQGRAAGRAAPSRENAPRTTASPASGGAASGSLLDVQRAAGNRAAGVVVQRASKKQKETARTKAASDFKGGGWRTTYFAGNFLANHLREPEEVSDRKSVSGKQLRGEAVRAWSDRSGGGGWGGQAQRPRGTNSVIIGSDAVILRLMEAVNVAQIDPILKKNEDYLHFQTEGAVPAVTVASDADGTLSDADATSGRANLGAAYSQGDKRFQINHFGGLA